MDPINLLSEVKNYLDITWADTAGDNKLLGFIARGMDYVNGAAGESLDFSREEKPKELLFEYVRYARSNALNEFQTNYLHEILSLQIDKEASRHAAESAEL